MPQASHKFWPGRMNCGQQGWDENEQAEQLPEGIAACLSWGQGICAELRYGQPQVLRCSAGALLTVLNDGTALAVWCRWQNDPSGENEMAVLKRSLELPNAYFFFNFYFFVCVCVWGGNKI